MRGSNSLDLVVFLNWIKDSLTDRNAPELAERVNPRLLSSISIRDLFGIARQFVTAPAAATRAMAEFFTHAYEARVAAEKAKMQADRSYKAVDRRVCAPQSQTIGTLITGGTGFLGPFLLDALLKQSTRIFMSWCVPGTLSKPGSAWTRRFWKTSSTLKAARPTRPGSM